MTDPTSKAERFKAARVAYERVRGLAWADYERVEGPAWAEFERVRGLAWADYVHKVRAIEEEP